MALNGLDNLRLSAMFTRKGGQVSCCTDNKRSLRTVMGEQRIVFSDHALMRLEQRGVSKDEVEQAIRNGERMPAKKGRLCFRLNFDFNRHWGGKYYAVKQVVPIAVAEKGEIVVVTVYAFYF